MSEKSKEYAELCRDAALIRAKGTRVLPIDNAVLFLWDDNESLREENARLKAQLKPKRRAKMKRQGLDDSTGD